MTLPEILADLGDVEVVRTGVDYGSPGGYMITVVRQYDDADQAAKALLFVGSELVAVKRDCDGAGAPGHDWYDIEQPEVVLRHNINVGEVIEYALEAMGDLFVKACGGY